MGVKLGEGGEQLTYSQGIWPTDFWPNEQVSIICQVLQKSFKTCILLLNYHLNWISVQKEKSFNNLDTCNQFFKTFFSKSLIKVANLLLSSLSNSPIFARKAG